MCVWWGENPRPHFLAGSVCFPEDSTGEVLALSPPPIPRSGEAMETPVSQSLLPTFSCLCCSTKQLLLSGRRSGLRLGGCSADCQCLIIGSRFLFLGSCLQFLHCTEGSLSWGCRRLRLGQSGGHLVSAGFCLFHTVAFIGCV